MINLTDREEKILDYWSKDNVNHKVKEKNIHGKKFYFLDGPPYATGDIASHHIWVVTIKDIVLRYKRYQGFNVHDRAGFDVHGLPIENKVERSLNIKSKFDIENTIGVAKFVAACRKYAEEQVEGATKMFMRYAYSADFKNAYLPYNNVYISRDWAIFKEIQKKGLLYKDLQPLAYCPHCETVLSSQGPEVEYEDETDKTVFIRYKVNQSRVKFGQNTYLVIWTTTPWTLPANMAIAANPKAIYVTVHFEGADYVVAKDRLEAFSEAIGKSVVIKHEFSGSELVGTTYTSPLEKQIPMQKSFAKYHKVLDGERVVTLSEGTGLLHVAPGHGPEDYTLAKANKIPIFSPVDAHAKYTEDAGDFNGIEVPKQANDAIMHALKESGDLLAVGSVTHTYPHCWRCNSKLIFRATEQWFMNVQKLKKKMVSENRKIKWHPEVAQKWQEDAILSSPDWCISRQRYWGAPIPVWICEGCKEQETIGSVEELVKRGGLAEEPKDLHIPHIDHIRFKCTKCGGTMHRVPDILDVWYDAGVSHTASLTHQEFEKLFPADWITESRDQIRGWFSVLLRTSVAIYGKKSFNEVNIGGMILDEIGREMHRHLGNSALAQDLITMGSADGYRLWCASHPRWQELKLKKRELTDADGDIIMLYNISELVKEFAELAGYDLKNLKKPSASKLEKEEQWILSRLNSLIMRCTENLNNYAIDVAVNELRDFIVEDLSRFYLKFAKQRAASGSKSDLKRVAVITAHILYNISVMTSIVAPFSCDYIYQELFSKNKESIFIAGWPKASKKFINPELEADFTVVKETITAILNSREKAGVALRYPISKATVEVTDDGAFTSLERLSAIVEDSTNAKRIELKRVSGVKKEVKPNFGKLGPDFKQKANAVAVALKNADAAAIMKGVEDTGSYNLQTTEGGVEIKPEHFTIVDMVEEGDAVAFRYGRVYVDKTITAELKEEAMIREFERHIQMIRKDLNLKKTDKISLNYETTTGFAAMIKNNAKKISKDLNSTKLGTELEHDGKVKELNIEGEIVKVSVKKL